MRKIGLIASLFLAITFLVSTVSALSCGDTITENTVLTEDLYCEGTAITIDADNIIFDGNGHTLQGDGTGAGVYVMENKGIVIKNVIVRNFENGIWLLDDGQNSEIYNNVLEGNGNGLSIVVFGTRNKIHNNVFRGNDRGIFISLFSNGNEIYNNKFIGNGDAGIRIIQSYYNYFYENRFLQNNIQVDDLSEENYYDKGGVGNYWDDFESNSGFEDNEYIVSDNAVDNYPYWFQAKCGDVNADGNLNRADVNYLASYVFGGGDAPMPLWTGDVNRDKVYDILDVSKLINNIIRGKGSLSCSIKNKSI